MFTAFLLHRRPYRETSLLTTFFTYDNGLITLIAKGAKRPRSPFKNLLMPFTPLLIDYQGRSDLKTLTRVDIEESFQVLMGDALASGFYLNELIMRLLKEHDPYPELYKLYYHCLQQLSDWVKPACALRAFEFSMLATLGYGVDLTTEARTMKPITRDNHYVYLHQEGFVLANAMSRQTFTGEMLHAIANQDWDVPQVLSEARRLTALLLKPLLGNKPLKSRDLVYV